MLELVISEKELYDENIEEFVVVKGAVIRLEHSLVSISKWESKWKKPFLKPKYEFTDEEFVDYIKCMTITQNVPDALFKWMSYEEKDAVRQYLSESFTATTFFNRRTPPSRQTVTSELIYYWMVAYQIPFECQKWNITRLFTLIEICNIKNSPNKKVPMNTVLRDNAKLNEARRKALGTRG